eukprot:3384058-Rhodomonas_salina.1
MPSPTLVKVGITKRTVQQRVSEYNIILKQPVKIIDVFWCSDCSQLENAVKRFLKTYIVGQHAYELFNYTETQARQLCENIRNNIKEALAFSLPVVKYDPYTKIHESDKKRKAQRDLERACKQALKHGVDVQLTVHQALYDAQL